MKKQLFPALLALLLLAGCAQGDPAELHEEHLFAMDTVMSITAYGPQGGEAVAEAAEEVRRLDALWSVGSADSEISRLNAAGGGEVSADTGALLLRAGEVYADTGGLFDISVFPLVELWGFTTDHPAVPSADAISEVLPLVDGAQVSLDGSTLTLGQGQRIDLGGIAKGYTSQRIMEIFKKHGVRSGIVSLGGNVQALGSRPDDSPWRVAVRDPEDSSRYAAVLSVEDKAVITSGGYERWFEEDGEVYIHIIDPRTGHPAQSDLLSVTVISDHGTLADGLSTALYIMGRDAAANFWRERQDKFDLVLITRDGSLHVTPGVRDALETEKSVVIID